MNRYLRSAGRSLRAWVSDTLENIRLRGVYREARGFRRFPPDVYEARLRRGRDHDGYGTRRESVWQ